MSMVEYWLPFNGFNISKQRFAEMEKLNMLTSKLANLIYATSMSAASESRRKKATYYFINGCPHLLLSTYVFFSTRKISLISCTRITIDSHQVKYWIAHLINLIIFIPDKLIKALLVDASVGLNLGNCHQAWDFSPLIYY